MVCRRYNEALNEVAAGGAATAEFGAHLAGCAGCQAGLARLKGLLAIADEQLRTLSSIEPSNGFEARLRAAEYAPRPTAAWHGGWLWPSLATAAVLIMAFVLFVADRPPSNAIVAESRPTPPPAPPSPSTAPAPTTRTEVRVLATTPPPRARRLDAAEQQVLVPVGESEALVELVALMNRMQLAPAALRTAGEPSTQLAALPAINIKPIEIVPLDPAQTPGT